MELAAEHYSPDITEAAPCTYKRNIQELMQWLRELEEKEKALKQVEGEFLRTRNEELLKPFQFKGERNLVKLKEPIEGPFYLSDIPEYINNASDSRKKQNAGRVLENIRQDAAIFNPKAEIRIVETTDGKQFLAIIGVDFNAFDSFRVLRNQERKVERDIAKATQALTEKIANASLGESEHGTTSVPHVKMSSIGHGKGK